MPKHRLHEQSKTFMRNYMGSDKDEELIRGNKAEMDDKVHKILKYLKEQEEEDDDDDNDDSKKIVPDLIDDIHNSYNSLYEHYNNMTEELRREAHRNHGEEDTSSSSSSDSSDVDHDSQRRNGEKNGKIRNEASTQISDLTQQVNSLEKEVEILQHTNFALEDQCRKLEAQLQDYQEDLNRSEKKIEVIAEQYQKNIDAKDQEIVRLEDIIEDLKQELEMKIDEIGTMSENMRTTEVKQRLTSQKLRIMEQLLGEKDESHQERVDKVLEEQRLLEEKNEKLMDIIAVSKEAQVTMVREISEKVHNLLDQIDTLSVKFDEDYTHLESRVDEIVSEVKAVMKSINETNVEKDQLKKEIDMLVPQLKDGKEQVSLLNAKVRELETTLCGNSDEINRLIRDKKEHEERIQNLEKTIREREEKMIGLEQNMNEKENGILRLCEEKREAIRQLCTSIDYHRNRYNDLKDMIMKKGGRRRWVT